MNAYALLVCTILAMCITFGYANGSANISLKSEECSRDNDLRLSLPKFLW
ncbi:hypothetical protein OESDEN_02951 [Oesophagostomum dentatum]|uniref:Uncharacterized protein n=1 Tax=Oesophagostomum dentatum TaxID=61180 RepID=A0A0B1TNW3_OESDE|nr:hypothetical protein OESDEN_02951 [Oesophagostomum dentatum]